MARKLTPAQQTVGRPRKSRPSSDTLLGSLALRVESLRDAKGMTALELTKASGVGNGTILRIERGEVAPSIVIIAKIARGFGMTPREFMSPVAEW